MTVGLRALMLGPPGAGKGTQGSRLAERFGVPHIASGDLLRHHVDAGTPVGDAVQAAMRRGDLIDDVLVTQMVLDEVFGPEASTGFVLDGFPRNLDQAMQAYERAQRHGITLQAVLLLEMPADVLIDRLLERARSENRSDDTTETIGHRLEVYREETAPLTEYYEDRGLLVRIDGTGSIEDVSGRIDAAVDARHAENRDDAG